jgi:hypothetical protein
LSPRTRTTPAPHSFYGRGARRFERGAGVTYLPVPPCADGDGRPAGHGYDGVQTETMKLKILTAFLAAVVGLHFLNTYLNETPRYMERAPSTGTPASGEVRNEFTVGFLPVT